MLARIAAALGRKRNRMEITEALQQLGVTANTLSADEKQMLDRDGYLVLSNILTKEQVETARKRLDLLSELEGADAGKEVHQEAGTARLSNLVDKGEIFRICFTHPKVLAGIAHVLQGDLKLS